MQFTEALTAWEHKPHSQALLTPHSHLLQQLDLLRSNMNGIRHDMMNWKKIGSHSLGKVFFSDDKQTDNKQMINVKNV